MKSDKHNNLNISASRDIIVGRDVVGGDKYEFTFNIGVQADKAFELQGQFTRLVEKFLKEHQQKKPLRRKPSTEYKRKLLYHLDLNSSHEKISEQLSKWRFVEAFPSPPTHSRPIAAVSNGNMGIGGTDSTTFHSPPIPELANCSVECELRIKSDAGGIDRWAGFRVRGFRDDIQFGYLLYLRSRGRVELYRAQGIIYMADQITIPDTKDTWTKLRLDILASKIIVWINDKPVRELKDRKFCDKGMVYLHTFGTHAQYQNFRVYRFVK